MHPSSGARRGIRALPAAAAAALIAAVLVLTTTFSFVAPAGATVPAATSGDPVANAAATAVAALQDFTAASAGASSRTVTAVRQKRYDTARREVARLTAERLGADAAQLDAIWAQTSSDRMTAVLTGLAQVGDPYRYRGSGPDGFDCSGFTSYAWAAAGVTLTRQSGAQASAMVRRDGIEQVQPGDLVWRPGHVMMSLGLGDYVVHSPQSGEYVEVVSARRFQRVGSPI
jgi:peptidoglycan DL-endopeptidase CwlO